MAQLNKAEARAACEAIFDKCAEPWNRINPAKAITFHDWNNQPDVAESVHSRVFNVLSTGNFMITPTFWTWWEEVSQGGIYAKINNDPEYREMVAKVWREIVAGRADELDTKQLADEGFVGTYELPEGWVRETADLYIGPHSVNLAGPEAISVHENYGISGAGSLRTDGDPIWREPNTRVDITIDIVYASEKEINKKFRPLLAFLRACPLTILESSILNSTMLRHLQEEGLFARLAAAQKNWEANEGKLKEILAKRGVNDAETLAQLKSELQGEGELAHQIEELAAGYTAPPSEGVVPGPLPHVPVMFTGVQVQSIGQGTHMFRARLSFTFMNDLAVTADGLRFLDGVGNETDSIFESVWLKRYVELSWLNPEQPDLFMPEYPKDGAKMVFVYDSEIAPFLVDPVVEDGKDIIVEGVMCGFTNKVVHIPLLGQEVPSCQFLGRNNSTVELLLNCTLKGVDKITRVKSSIEANIRSRVKDAREDQIDLVLPIVNTMGFSEYVISRMQTKTNDDMTDRIQVVVTLVENRVKMQNRETLVLNNQAITKKAAKSLWDYIWSIYRKQQDGLLPKEQYGEYKYVAGLLFGSRANPLEKCLINADVIRATTWLDDDLREFLGEFWLWTEGHGVGIVPPLRDNPTRNTHYAKKVVFVGGKLVEGAGAAPVAPDLSNYFAFRGGSYTKTVGYTPDKVITDVEYQNLHVSEKARATRVTYHGKNTFDTNMWRLPGTKGKEVRGGGSSKLRQDFLWAWRHTMATQEDKEPGDIRNRQKIALQFRDGVTIVQPKLSDAFFETIWKRQNPKAWTHLDREHRLWAAKRQQAMDAPIEGGDISFLKVGKGNAHFTVAPTEQDRMKRKAKFERDNPRRDIEDAPSLWEKGRVNDSFRTLHMIATNMTDLFPEWKIDGQDPAVFLDKHVGFPTSRYDPTRAEQDLKSLSCYPDFALPTYRQLFTFGGGLNAVWTEFAPAASSLGITEEELGEKFDQDAISEAIGVDVDDLVEPTFFYSTGRYKKAAKHLEGELIAEEVVAAAVKDKNFVQVDMTFDELNQKVETGSQIGHLYTLINDLTNMGRVKKYHSADAKELFNKLADGTIPEISITTNDNFIVAVAVRNPDDKTGKKFNIVPKKGVGRRIHFLDNSPDFDTTDPAQIRKGLKDTMERMREDKQDVKRCFPTFRFRIIDFDTGLYSDEFYDYNAVRSIHIFHDKEDASTLEMEIMNVTGILDTDTFFISSEENEIGLPGDDEQHELSDERAGRYFKSIKLKEGTAVQVLLGYSPDVRQLETAFSGRISQYQVGDVVKIIAQGYKTELLNEISFKKEDASFAEIVRTAFQHLDGEGHKENTDDIKVDERRNGTPHLGSRYDMANDSQRVEHNRIMQTLFGAENLVYGSGAWKWTGPYGVDFLKIHQDTDIPSLTVDGRNYLDLFSSKPSRMRNIYLKAFVQNKLNLWFTSYQPGWDVFKEITSFMPGWVCEVVPYDHLATLYIGPPDGEYFWTSRFNRRIIKGLRKSRDKAQSVSDERAAIVRAMKEFKLFVRKWIVGKRKEDRESSDVNWWNKRRDIALHAGRSKEKWLPDSARERNIETVVKDVRSRNEDVFRALIGAFFGFDLVSRSDFPAEVSTAVWSIIDNAVSFDGKGWDAPFKFESNGEFMWLVTPLESLQDGIEYLVNNTPGFDLKMYQLSSFSDHELQEVVGSLAFLGDRPYTPRTMILDDLSAVSWMERQHADPTFTPKEILLGDSMTQEEINERRGLAYRTPWDVIHPLAALARWEDSTPARFLRGEKIYGGVFEIPMYPPRNYTESFGELIVKNVMDLKTYLYLITEFMSNSDNDEIIKIMGAAIADYRVAYKTPDRRPFRDKHFVTSRYDIIENNIVASTKEMANSILLRHPHGEAELEEIDSNIDGAPDAVFLDEVDTDWTVFQHPDGVPWHPDLRLEQRKLAITIEKNANTKEKAALVFLNRMGEALRPMYRGNIILWGRVIKPHDLLYINDDYNTMNGHVEVERVIHHFTAETGWTTTVIPHAFVHVDNAIDIFQSSVLERWYNALGVVLEVADWASLALALFTFGGSAVLKVGFTALRGLTKKAMAVAVRKVIKKKVSNTFRRKALGTGIGGTGARLTTGPLYRHQYANQLIKQGLDRAESPLLTAGVEGVREAIQRGGAAQFGKAVGRELAPLFKNGLQSVAAYSGLSVARVFVDGYNNSIVTSGSEKLQGVVCMNHLMFEGRPLTAGLDNDDRYYLSQLDGMWSYTRDRAKKFWEAVEDFVPDLLAPKQAENEEFGGINAHLGVK